MSISACQGRIGVSKNWAKRPIIEISEVVLKGRTDDNLAGPVLGCDCVQGVIGPVDRYALKIGEEEVFLGKLPASQCHQLPHLGPRNVVYPGWMCDNQLLLHRPKPFRQCFPVGFVGKDVPL